jgi:hypothetical protein
MAVKNSDPNDMSKMTKTLEKFSQMFPKETGEAAAEAKPKVQAGAKKPKKGWLQKFQELFSSNKSLGTKSTEAGIGDNLTAAEIKRMRTPGVK